MATTTCVIENQRWWVGAGWRKTSNDKDGKTPSTFASEDAKLPKGWEWTGPWTVACDGTLDIEGWVYCHAFSANMTWSAKKSVVDVVRSRRWERVRRPIGSSSNDGQSEEKKGFRLGMFFNAKSGGGKGIQLYERYTKQNTKTYNAFVYNLSNGGPEPGLRELLWGDAKATIKTADPSLKGTKVRVLAAGGDGTGAWLLSVIDKLIKEVQDAGEEYAKVFVAPAMRMTPLGTGNDLARVQGFGGSFKDENNLSTLCKSIVDAKVMMLDRWTVSIHPAARLPAKSQEKKTDNEEKEIKQEVKTVTMNNYMGIGVVADVALAFHEQREARPGKKQTQAGNIVIYSMLGAERALARPYNNIHSLLRLEIDDKTQDLSPSAPNGHILSDISILNIPSFSGGANLWGKAASPHAPAMDDKQCEVIGLRDSLHVGLIKSKMLAGLRLGHGGGFTITTTQDIPMQIDGEAWMQPAAKIVVTHFTQSRVLRKN